MKLETKLSQFLTNLLNNFLTNSDFFSGTGLHYKAGDEPEPIDLTHLNIEAAMMCLASKIRLLCGKANSPTLSSRTFRFKELDAKRGGNNTTTDNFKVGTTYLNF